MPDRALNLDDKEARLNDGLCFLWSEISETFVRASGPGGQNVNKVSSAVELRWSIHASALPSPLKQRLLERKDRRITKDGELVIQAMRFRTQERNRIDARERLLSIIEAGMVEPVVRKATKPSRSQVRKRLNNKAQRGELKRSRGKSFGDDG